MVVKLVRSGRKQPQLYIASAGGKARHPYLKKRVHRRGTEDAEERQIQEHVIWAGYPLIDERSDTTVARRHTAKHSKDAVRLPFIEKVFLRVLCTADTALAEPSGAGGGASVHFPQAAEFFGNVSVHRSAVNAFVER